MSGRRSHEVRHPGTRPGCRDCLGEGYIVTREGERAVARTCDCVGVCPLCHDTGLVSTGTERFSPRRRCDCQHFAQRLRTFDQVLIPARHAESTRASFVRSSNHQMVVFKALTAYLDDYDPQRENRGVVLWGGVGRGKTHLLVALLRELVFRYGVTARFVEFSHLLADLKSGFDSGRGAAELIDPLVAVDVLAIDELGKGRNTEFEGTVLDELVSRRYNAVRPILATTNYAPLPSAGRAVANAAEVQVGVASVPTLVDRVGDRVWSRLRETAEFYEVKGDDFRERRRGRTSAPSN